MHREIRAPVAYLPEYLWHEPLRVLRGWRRARRLPGYARARAAWLKDLRRDLTPNRGRRFGQALVLAAELPARGRAAARALPAHAGLGRALCQPDDRHRLERLGARQGHLDHPGLGKGREAREAAWVVTCTRVGADHLKALAPDPDKVTLLYHGLDLGRFPPVPGRRPPRDGTDAADPVTILSVGRAVEKKGYGDLVEALARLPRGLAWRFEHIGGGPLLPALKQRAAALGLADRIAWRGAQPQDAVLDACRRADLFALASRIAGDGDRDGLPNVLMEAQSQALPVVATRVSAIPELVEDGTSAILVEPVDHGALAKALQSLIADPGLRTRLGEAGERRVRERFDMNVGADELAARFADTRERATPKPGPRRLAAG